MIKREYTPDELASDARIIAWQIHEDQFYPDWIIAPDRGGAIPAATIRRLLQDLNPAKSPGLYIKEKEEDWKNLGNTFSLTPPFMHDILIVDDICDTGKEFDLSFDRFKIEGNSRIRYASLIQNWPNEFNFQVEYYSQRIDKSKDDRWIHFWWED